MKKRHTGGILLFGLFFSACSVSKQINRLVKKDILKNVAFASAHTGISIYEPATQKYWCNYQGDKYFVPASNTKLPTCYAAMKYLGDSLVGMRYHEANDTLFITATADPTFLHPDFPDQKMYDFLKSTGKTIILNTSLWQEERWGSGWAWNDYNDDYMAERSVMPIYGNVARFSKVAKEIQVSPPYFKHKIISDEIKNADSSPIFVQREISSNDFFIRETDSLFNNIEIPFYTGNESIFTELLEDTLHKPLFQGSFSSVGKTSSEKEFHSQSTDSLLKLMMHHSDNFFAEQSLLMVSTKLLNSMNDERIIKMLLESDFNNLPQKPNWVDGSGLSRYNLFSPQDFVAILNKMKTEFGIERIKNILPTGGAGTLSNYYKADSGFIFAKTGTLSGVVALSGFVYTRKNKLLIFSVLVNNHHSSATIIRRSIESFIKELRNKN